MEIQLNSKTATKELVKELAVMVSGSKCIYMQDTMY